MGVFVIVISCSSIATSSSVIVGGGGGNANIWWMLTKYLLKMQMQGVPLSFVSRFLKIRACYILFLE